MTANFDAPHPGDDPHPVIPWLTKPRRQWLYGVTLAAQPLAVALSVATDNVIALGVAVVLAMVSTGVALPNTQGTV